MGIPPYPLAMVVCDAVHRDPGTGKIFLLGTFSTIVSAVYPACHPAMALYVAVTDAHGSFDVRVTIVDAAEQRPPVADIVNSDLRSVDPRAVHEMAIDLRGLVFPVPGEYRVKLSASGEFLMERRIVLLEQTPSTDEA